MLIARTTPSDTQVRSRQERLEAACLAHPKRFARLTGLWALLLVSAMLGFGVFALMGLVLAVAGLINTPTNPLFLALFLSCAYALWVGLAIVRSRPARPTGLRLTAESAPRFFQLLEKICRKTDAPMPGRVVLDGEMRVCLIYRPRWGLLGGYRNTLVVGMPLLLLLDVKQVGSLLAHEIAHQGPTHGTLNSWVYRTRRAWAAQHEAALAAGMPSWFKEGPVWLFWRYVFPGFNARALVMGRHQAFDADRAARRVAGSEATMEALVKVSVHRRYLNDFFWPEVFSRVSHSPAPNVKPFYALRQRLSVAKAHVKAPHWLNESLHQPAAAHDTHPSLSERLARAKLTARLSKPPQHSSAQLLLRESLEPLLNQMDERWQVDVAPRWGQLHRRHVAQARLEQELQAEGEQGALHADDHLLWAHAARTVQGDAAYEALLRLMLIDHPNHATARFELGQLLIKKDGDAFAVEGPRLLRAVALEQDNPEAHAAALIYQRWLSSQTDNLDSAFWRDEVRLTEVHAAEARAAMFDFDSPVQWMPTDLSARTVRLVRERLAREEGVRQAYLVKKELTRFPRWRFGVLLLSLDPAVGGLWTAHRLEALRQELALPGESWVMIESDPVWTSKLRTAAITSLKATSGASIYKRGSQVSQTVAGQRYMPA